MPNTAKVIYAWDKKILTFSKNSKFCKQKIYKNDHIIDIHVITEGMTTDLMIDTLGDETCTSSGIDMLWFLQLLLPSSFEIDRGLLFHSKRKDSNTMTKSKSQTHQTNK